MTGVGRKRAKEAAGAHELEFRDLVDRLPGFVVVMDGSGIPRFASKRILDYTGWTVEDLADWRPLVHPDDLDDVVNVFRNSIRSGIAKVNEFRMLGADGGYRWFQSRAVPLNDNEGRPVRWCFLYSDVNDRKAVEQELRLSQASLLEAQSRLRAENAALAASERELNLIIETIPGLVWCASSDGEFTYVNQRVLDYTGTTFEDLAERRWVELVHPGDTDDVVDQWSHSITSGETLDSQFRLRRFDGSFRWFRCIGRPLLDDQERVIRWYGLLIDIDERERMAEALRQTETRLARAAHVATVGELAASIAHEVNQPLAAAVANGAACLRWLDGRPANLAKAREAAERVVRDGTEAGNVVQRVRALFRRTAVEMVRLDLNEVILEVAGLVDGEATRRDVEVGVELAAGLPHVAGDRLELQQLLLNLILNAMEATETVTDRPKRVVIRSDAPDANQVLVEVEDSGVGVQDAGKIFEAFVTTKETGLGMGLVISRSVVEAHGGRLWTDPVEAGGTYFRFLLPAFEGRAGESGSTQ